MNTITHRHITKQALAALVFAFLLVSCNPVHADQVVTNTPTVSTNTNVDDPIFLSAVAVIQKVQAEEQVVKNLSAGTNSTASVSPLADGAGTLQPLDGLVALLVPLLVALIKTKILPKIPTQAIPILASLFGVIGTWIMGQIGLSHLPPLYGAILGSAGVGIREIKDQLFPVATPVMGSGFGPLKNPDAGVGKLPVAITQAPAPVAAAAAPTGGSQQTT